MSRVDIKTQVNLLKEAGVYFKSMKSLDDTSLEKKRVLSS